MNLLLPYKFKKTGLVLVPVGLTLWLLMQKGICTQVLVWLFGRPQSADAALPYHSLNVLIAITGFFSFLGGLYCLAFSKEKMEDEMIRQIRLETFQFASAAQLIVVIFGFLLMLYAEPEQEGLLLFFLFALGIFWIAFIVRFNYVIHVKLKNEELR